MSENASSQVIDARYNHKEVVINAHWQYDQRASMAYEILKEMLKNPKLKFEKLNADVLVDIAFEIEENFNRVADNNQMIVHCPGELPVKDSK